MRSIRVVGKRRRPWRLTIWRRHPDVKVQAVFILLGVCCAGDGLRTGGAILCRIEHLTLLELADVLRGFPST